MKEDMGFSGNPEFVYTQTKFFGKTEDAFLSMLFLRHTTHIIQKT